jgi:hypothetical protein
MRPRNPLPVLLIAIGLLGCKSSSSSSSQEDADRAAIASIAHGLGLRCLEGQGRRGRDRVVRPLLGRMA